jgi:MYXO-CTERM domain-containing protein
MVAISAPRIRTAQARGAGEKTIAPPRTAAESVVKRGSYHAIAAATPLASCPFFPVSGGRPRKLFTVGAFGATVDASGSGPVAFTGTGAIAFTATSAVSLVLTGTNAGNNRLAPTIGDVAAGTPTSLVKNGSGTWTLAGANTYSGATTINAGRLTIGTANAIAPANAVNLAGGTFDTGGLSDSAGPLTLATSSGIDFGAGTSTLAFADSHALTWSGTLLISNWSGDSVNGGGTDQLFFGNSAGGLTAAQLAGIQFAGFGPGATILPSGEVVPTAAPEPTGLALAALVGAALLRRRRRRID